MKVAIDISPLSSGHRVRGIGAYTKYLVHEFQKQSFSSQKRSFASQNGNWDISFEFFQNPKSPPEADIIHYPYFDLFFHTLPYKKNASRVVTIHDVIPLVFPAYFPAGLRGYINLFFQKRSLKNTDFVICDSQTSKQDIADKLSYPKEKIKVIYLAASENFRTINNQYTLKNTSKKFNLPRNFVLYVGDVNWNKNLEGLIKAIKIVRIPLVMVGGALTNSNLPQTKNINKLIKKLHLEKQVFKTGFVEDENLVAIYNLATLTILPSYYEGFGLPVLESMACGTPVVCSKAGSLSEIAGPAIICDPDNPADIARKITSVLNLSRRGREKLTQKCQKHASGFTWQKVARETVKVYRQVAKSHRQ